MKIQINKRINDFKEIKITTSVVKLMGIVIEFKILSK